MLSDTARRTIIVESIELALACGDAQLASTIVETVASIREAERSSKKISPKYMTRDRAAMRKEIEKHAHKRDDDPSAYDSHPKGGWKADYTKGGKRYKTKKSKYTSLFQKRFGEGEELNEALGASVRKALKNKAEKANAPLGALTTVYRKGLAAWKTGHRPGTSQHQWAMGRVNSFLTGGKARGVDAAQWKQVQKYRKGKKRRVQEEIARLDEVIDILIRLTAML